MPFRTTASTPLEATKLPWMMVLGLAVAASIQVSTPAAADIVTGPTAAEPDEAEIVSELSSARTTTVLERAVASSGDGGRVHLPASDHYGDVVYAPNVSHYLPHGHAAIFATFDRLVHAPGGGTPVIEQDRHDAKSFATGAKMMSVYTDEGDGPLLSLTKREVARDWARSRIGDKYRSFTSPNHKVVTGAVGSDGSKQNCSQLIWAAYNVANGYDFNPVPYWLWGTNPVEAAIDKKYVLPKEIQDAPQTVVYNTVNSDYDL
ncbi:exported hypothetical protein [metagenome]|uniref:Uncharacterized protein n=1 Tax=metagenome TaxID=256318 RepID=A0A2P2CD12_9ZZZZ